jgi:hypothetical protein
MTAWPHEKVRGVALWYIRRHVRKEDAWCFTQLDSLPESLAGIAQFEPEELPVVACYIDPARWYVMSTSRIFGAYRSSQFDVTPLDVVKWRWGVSKGRGNMGSVETAQLSLADRSRIAIAYETGYASMAPMYYERFWRGKYRALVLSAARI